MSSDLNEREEEAREQHEETAAKHVYDIDEDMVHHVDGKEYKDQQQAHRDRSDDIGYEERAERHEEHEKLGSIKEEYNTMFREQ